MLWLTEALLSGIVYLRKVRTSTSFTRTSNQGKGRRLTPRDILKTRRIAAVRIHVERAIERLTRFRIFRGIMDLGLAPVCDQMAIVAAVICNLDNPLF